MDAGGIGCILLASGLSLRYGRNKLLEKLGGREVILHAAGNLVEAGFAPLAVTRSREVEALLNDSGIRCAHHEGPKKSDSIHVGLENVDADAAGYLFMPADQPLVRPETLRRLAAQFERQPTRAVRLWYWDTPGSPVIFPAAFRKDLLAYTGDRGGMEVLKMKNAPCDAVQAAHEWELWDVDTPEMMDRVRQVYENLRRS